MRETFARLLIGLAALTALALAGYYAADPVPPIVAEKDDVEAKKPEFVVFPFLQYPTETSITIVWETENKADATLRIGPSAKEMKPVEVAANAAISRINLTGLKAETNYVYRVSVENGPDSGVLQFATARKPGSPIAFAVVGDTQANPKTTAQVAKQIYERRPDFVIHCGDVVDLGRDKRMWVEELFRPCGGLFSRVAVLPTIGNHEANHPLYYMYFDLPEPEYYYRFRSGDAEFFALDTNKNVRAGSEQYLWLEKALSASTARWKFAFHHHPCYSSDRDDYGDTAKSLGRQGDLNARALVPLYEKFGVDLVFNGHIHLYERSRPIRNGKVERLGVTYITSGGGGGKLEDVDPLATWFKAQVRVDYHYCLVDIDGDRLEFKAFDKDGHLFDALDIDKGKK